MICMEDFLRDNGYLIRPIHGRSMLPMLEEATDAVRLTPVTRELVPGDIPLYRRPDGTYVLHRILAVRKNCYVIRGDNCAFLEKVPKAWVIAVTEGYFKKGDYVPVTDEGYQAYVRRVLETNESYEAALRYHANERGRARVLLSMLFPSYRAMRERHPSLRYLPFFLPFAWLFRLLRMPFSANGRRFFASTVRCLFGKSSHSKT